MWRWHCRPYRRGRADMMIATAALLLAVDLVATTSHHRPRSPPPGQSEIVVWKKVCPMVTAARAAGMTDDQIIAVAVAQGVSPGVIVWAKKRGKQNQMA